MYFLFSSPTTSSASTSSSSRPPSDWGKRGTYEKFPFQSKAERERVRSALQQGDMGGVGVAVVTPTAQPSSPTPRPPKGALSPPVGADLTSILLPQAR